MNITLSVDEKVVRRSRQYAREHDTTLNKMVRNFLQRIGGGHDYPAAADEFARLAKNMAGKSHHGYTFNREEIHER